MMVVTVVTFELNLLGTCVNLYVHRSCLVPIPTPCVT